MTASDTFEFPVIPQMYLLFRLSVAIEMTVRGAKIRHEIQTGIGNRAIRVEKTGTCAFRPHLSPIDTNTSLRLLLA